ncbi:hypothetical protein CONLIGDRAFT_223682 [Coniochaeta ligniaria NRRL 30616]|uniref:Uncharacterized protein n=1 Tax=Coniochaeta ligniaria NRRL 30616 TaxID=1408157 RepID=A0A1J7IMN8_9PEZI|nr:hypothetical protein CONLIGDRAFT_223682 [Coniochaeta ligniaria NRRL 30616]
MQCIVYDAIRDALRYLDWSAGSTPAKQNLFYPLTYQRSPKTITFFRLFPRPHINQTVTPPHSKLEMYRRRSRNTHLPRRRRQSPSPSQPRHTPPVRHLTRQY